jgi:hypothetical protein
MKTMNRRLSKLEDRLMLPRFPKPQYQYRDRPLPQSNIFWLVLAMIVAGLLLLVLTDFLPQV